jgi:hypothetical protein
MSALAAVAATMDEMQERKLDSLGYSEGSLFNHLLWDRFIFVCRSDGLMTAY